MKSFSIALILICVFLTSCAKNNVDIPIEETTAKTESTTSEMPTSTSSNTTTQEINNQTTNKTINEATNELAYKTTNEMAIADTWVDVYSAILNGDNELGIDFYNYNLDIDGPENRRYYGCGLYDLDKDETPELFVSIGMWEGSFFHIYTCKDGKDVYVGQIYGRFVEKSTGILFNAFDEAGYTPDIAYMYTQGVIAEIPNYVQSFYETDGGVSKPKIKLGDNIYDYFSEAELYSVSIYDNLEWAVTNQEIDNAR